jgi:hypothetical protein
MAGLGKSAGSQAGIISVRIRSGFPDIGKRAAADSFAPVSDKAAVRGTLCVEKIPFALCVMTLK